jgi:alpha-D-ribose 1-methylphosphonate 5-triphosphate synthase subunit PhnL
VSLLLKINGLSKEFYLHSLDKRIHGCQGIDLELHQGEFVGITGKSGSGKSTILKLIYRTYKPFEGTIDYLSQEWGWVNLMELDERKVLHLRKQEIGYVSQFLHVIPRTSARVLLENAVLDMGGDPEFAKTEAVRMLSHFELDPELWDSYPSTFSGGEKLRLNIAQAMVKQPRFLLLDEPTASLDKHTKGKVRELIAQLKEAGTTMLGIFHDLEFMEGLCDREYRMTLGKVVV